LTYSDVWQPVLPTGTTPSPIPFSRYDMIQTYLNAQKQYTDLPDLTEDAVRDLKNLPEDTRYAFSVFYASTHPECSNKLDKDTKKTIIESILAGNKIEFEG
jgi:hypothetical protein